MALIADLLTTSRLVIALLIPLLGMRAGWGALEEIVVLTLVGWTTDTIDGHLARRSGRSQPSWIGRNEALIDGMMVLAMLAYLAMLGVISPRLVLIYAISAATLIVLTRSRLVAVLLETPPTVLLPVVALQTRPILGWAYVAWGLASVFLDRRRLRVRFQILWRDARKLFTFHG